jgi:soluble lytic murein transglycosylase
MRNYVIVAIIVVAAFLLFGLPALINPGSQTRTIQRYADQYRLDPLLVSALIKTESNFDPNARSARGAAGLMQLLPTTAKELARELHYDHFKESDLENPEININLGTYYLRKLTDEFHGNQVLALAAYNAGQGTVEDWYRKNPMIDVEIGNIPYQETREYLRRIQRTYRLLSMVKNIRGFFGAT